jgi:hypothetical protein
MADRVDPAIKSVQPPTLEPMVYRPPANAELDELPARHDPVLALREEGDVPVRDFIPQLTTYSVVNFGFIPHARSFSPELKRVTASA